jgi:peptidyl-prolyl cis-trans isomerase B (cyclophilin B)
MTEQDSTVPSGPDAQQVADRRTDLALNETNTLAVFSFIASLFFFLWLPSILAIVLGSMALSHIERTGQAGKGLAVLGIVLGFIGMVAGIVVFVLVMNSVSNETL